MADLSYTAEYFKAQIAVDEYIRRYRNEERFLRCCKECGNYGKMWACPPYDYDVESYIRQWSNALLMVSKITPREKELPLKVSRPLILPERKKLETELLAMEAKYGGRAFSYVGDCLYCKECTRIHGLPCRHPELVRPSLEAYGFDLSATLKDLFNLEIKWGVQGKMPEYLTLVGGLFHNSPAGVFEV